MLSKGAFYLCLPVLRLLLRNTRRVYVIIQNSDRQVLFVKNRLSDGQLHLPGGGSKRHESPVQTAQREVFEEVGLVIDLVGLELVCAGTWRTHALGYTYQIYSTAINTVSNLSVQKLELQWAAWLDPKQIFIKTPEITQALERVSSEWGAAAPQDTRAV